MATQALQPHLQAQAGRYTQAILRSRRRRVYTSAAPSRWLRTSLRRGRLTAADETLDRAEPPLRAGRSDAHSTDSRHGRERQARRYLVVTDHALDDQQLAATVQPSLAAGACQFYLLALASPAGTKNRIWWEVAVGGYSDRSQPSSTASAPNPGPAAEQGWDRAREQLAHNLVRLRKLGADADGETGEAHPLRAIGEVLARRPCDEIILATAPHRMTRLLAMHLQHRVHRSFGLPVTVLGIAPTES